MCRFLFPLYLFTRTESHVNLKRCKSSPIADCINLINCAIYHTRRGIVARWKSGGFAVTSLVPQRALSFYKKLSSWIIPWKSSFLDATLKILLNQFKNWKPHNRTKSHKCNSSFDCEHLQGIEKNRSLLVTKSFMSTYKLLQELNKLNQSSTFPLIMT